MSLKWNKCIQPMLSSQMTWQTFMTLEEQRQEQSKKGITLWKLRCGKAHEWNIKKGDWFDGTKKNDSKNHKTKN